MTRLGTYLETRVNNFLRANNMSQGDVIVRVVSSCDKNVETKPHMREKCGGFYKYYSFRFDGFSVFRFCPTGEFPESFPYRAKALFAFEEIDGADVCFFGMHVQEYGSECDPPNARYDRESQREDY